LDEGTTRIEDAEKLAAILGTKPSKHFRRKKKTGKQIDLLAWYQSQAVDGCAFRDFINAKAYASRLGNALAREYGRDIRLPDHFDSCDELGNYAELIGYETEQAHDLWNAFLLWRIDAIGNAAKAKLGGGEDYDFG
jgi:hypothetical protein